MTSAATAVSPVTAARTTNRDFLVMVQSSFGPRSLYIREQVHGESRPRLPCVSRALDGRALGERKISTLIEDIGLLVAALPDPRPGRGSTGSTPSPARST